jgi:hypothetical protein
MYGKERDNMEQNKSEKIKVNIGLDMGVGSVG